jgi:hypothetical protein
MRGGNVECMGAMRTRSTIIIRKPNGRDNQGDITIDGMVILKYIIRK